MKTSRWKKFSLVPETGVVLLKISETIKQVQEQLQAMLQEINELQLQVEELEQQNRHLRTLLYSKQEMGEGKENLLKLYREGFHICPTYFAGARRQEEDCIFCLGFLEGRQKVVD